ncbi:MAG: manganese catalase family protein [Huintestinicola sp.]
MTNENPKNTPSGGAMVVADSSPYPEIAVQGENPRYAAVLSSAFGGREGELTAISQYIYQSIVFGDSYPEYAEILRAIAIVEMRHLKMVGEIIEKLGGKVVFGSTSGGQTRFWDGTAVNYSDDIAAAIIQDINDEQKAYANYVALARQANDRHVFAALTRIALDEMIHTAVLKSLLAKLRRV